MNLFGALFLPSECSYSRSQRAICSQSAYILSFCVLLLFPYNLLLTKARALLPYSLP